MPHMRLTACHRLDTRHRQCQGSLSVGCLRDCLPGRCNASLLHALIETWAIFPHRHDVAHRLIQQAFEPVAAMVAPGAPRLRELVVVWQLMQRRHVCLPVLGGEEIAQLAAADECVAAAHTAQQGVEAGLIEEMSETKRHNF